MSRMLMQVGEATQTGMRNQLGNPTPWNFGQGDIAAAALTRTPDARDTAEHAMLRAMMYDVVCGIERARTLPPVNMNTRDNACALRVRRVELADVAEDLAWVKSDSVAPFSFVWVCHQLGLEPEPVRERILAGGTQARTDQGRRFESVRRLPPTPGNRYF